MEWNQKAGMLGVKRKQAPGLDSATLTLWPPANYLSVLDISILSWKMEIIMPVFENKNIFLFLFSFSAHDSSA